MPKTRSINQNEVADALPDFRSLGVVLRIVILVNLMAFCISVVQASSITDILRRFLEISAFLQPALLTSLLLLHILKDRLKQYRYAIGFVMTLAIVEAVTLFMAYLGDQIYMPVSISPAFYIFRAMAMAGMLTAFVLVYFRMRSLTFSTALQDARMQALQARIRPHFLFNSINAVLSIVRSDPRRAETALEDMADLFRMAMGNSEDLVVLRRELELCRQYIGLEKLRLGDRLGVNWQVEKSTEDAMIPPLILQPLLENAVYHGIEPLPEGGEVEISIRKNGNSLDLRISNPCRSSYSASGGNRMALENIRERLALRFDVEAKYQAELKAGSYHVHVQMPYVKEEQE